MLIVSLLFLLIMTLIGVTGMHGTIMEEKMAGNTRDRNLAFQAAESALRAGEAYASTFNPGDSANLFNGSQIGLYDSSHNPPKFWQTLDWSPTSTAVIRYTGTLSSDISAQPAYYIEKLPACPWLEVHSLKYCNYRITAYGTGGSVSAVVVLQSIYKLCQCK